MKRSKEVRQAITLSNLLISKLRRISVYKHWNKRDFVVCQSQHDKARAPTKSDHVACYKSLKRFAERNDLPIPTRPQRNRTKKQPNLKYDGTNGFTQWRKIRYEALKRSNGHCECCGATVKSSGEPLHVDHIKPKSLYPKLEFSLSNLQVLCADCNIGKGNWDETNWRDTNVEREAAEELDMKNIVDINKYK